jgi:hypothetical protein
MNNETELTASPIAEGREPTIDEIRDLASLPSNGSVYFDHVPVLLARVDALTSANAKLSAALDEALEYFEDREDVVDGSYGEPAPNKEMQLAQSIRAALRGEPQS